MSRTKFEDREAWQAARKLMVSAYRVTAAKDFEEDSDLRAQIRRASVCLLTDVGDLFQASTRLDAARCFRKARYSVTNLQSHLYVASDRYYIEPETFEELNDSAQELKEAIAEYFSRRP
jgi:four helix bundle protein